MTRGEKCRSVTLLLILSMHLKELFHGAVFEKESDEREQYYILPPTDHMLQGPPGCNWVPGGESGARIPALGRL